MVRLPPCILKKQVCLMKKKFRWSFRSKLMTFVFLICLVLIGLNLWTGIPSLLRNFGW